MLDKSHISHTFRHLNELLSSRVLALGVYPGPRRPECRLRGAPAIDDLAVGVETTFFNSYLFELGPATLRLVHGGCQNRQMAVVEYWKNAMPIGRASRVSEVIGCRGGSVVLVRSVRQGLATTGLLADGIPRMF